LSILEVFSERLDVLLSSDEAPLLVMVGGHNGAGKSTFYRLHLRDMLGSQMPHLDPDAFEREIAESRGQLERFNVPDEDRSKVAQRLCAHTRVNHFAHRRSFSFETVFSDEAGDKIKFLRDAQTCGYTTLLIGIGLASPDLSYARVLQRQQENGHGVPRDRCFARYPRVINNLAVGMRCVTLGLLMDNSEDAPGEGGYSGIAVFEEGELLQSADTCPKWTDPIICMSTH
jgi:predicted ABC-type ATPase